MKKYKLSGRVVRAKTERGVGSVRVEAWDSAEVTTDLVAVAVTNQTGDFEISLDQAAVDRHFQGRKPLIALRVFSPGAEEYVTRYTQWKVSPTPATVRIEVDLALTSTRRAPAQSVVRGIVRNDQGATVANATVRAYDVRLTSEIEIGSSTTDSTGHYKISYSPLLASGKQQPDLRVIVYNGSNQELGRSALIVRAPSTAVVDLVTSQNQEDRGPSELQQLKSRTAAHTQGVVLGTLQAEQVEFVAMGTEVDRGKVEALVAADSLLTSVGVGGSADSFYPFVRMGLPATRRGLLSYPKPALRRALDEAKEAKIVGGEVSDSFVDLLTQAAVDLAMGAPPAGATCSLGQLVELVLSEEGYAEQFLAEYLAFDGTPEAFWAHLASLPEYQSEGSLNIPRLQLVLQLGALTRYHFPLVEELWERWQDAQFAELKDLAAYSEADWIAVLTIQRNGSPINYPADTPGATVAERRATYAKVLRRALEEAFPSKAVASAIAAVGGSELPTFFNNNPSFKLGEARIGHFIASNPGAVAGLSNPMVAVRDLKVVERLHNLTPRYEEAKVLLDAGFKSAREISIRGKPRVGAELGAALGGVEIANDIYEKAVAVSDVALALSLKFGTAFNQGSAYALPNPARRASQPAPDLATYEALFGSSDACACAHCASVYGPAAYLVDMLRFLDRYSSTITKSGSTKWTAKELLLGSAPGSTPARAGRRPDIGRIDLTCQNADTPLPYVDLVNEILVHAFVGETKEQNEAPPAFPEHIATVGTAEELAAMPNPPSGEEDWHETAYERLAETDFPFSLPYHHRHHEARVYLEHLGVPLHAFLSELRASWSSPEAMYPEEAAAHRLGLSLRERDLIRGTSISGVTLASAWGVSVIPGGLFNVPVFLKRSGLSYNELRDLLETSVLHRFGSPAIQPADSCKIDEQSIGGLSDAVASLDILHRFLRLRLRLGWSIRELDQVLAACAPSGTDLVNNRALRVIAVIQALRADRGISLPIAVLASWFGPLDTRRRDAGETPSFYEQLFQNRAVTNPVDAALALPGVASLPTANLLADHTPAVLAGLRISREELSLLTEDSGLGLPPLVPADTSDLAPVTLAKLHRIVTFARALRLSLPDFHVLYNLSKYRPFEVDNPEHTLRFLDTVDRVRRSGLSPADLDVVFREGSSPRARISMTAEAAGPVLDQMFGALLALRGKNGDGAPDIEAEAALVEDTLAAALKLDARSTHLLIADILTTGEPGDVPLGSAFSLPASPPPSLDVVSRAAQLAAYRHLAKAAAVVQRLGASADEIERMFVLDEGEGATVALDLDALPRAEINSAGTGSPLFEAWEKLVQFVELRSLLVGPNPSLASLFVAGTPEQAATALAEATGWPAADVEQLLLARGYGPSNPLNPSNAAEQVSVLGLVRRAIVMLKRLGISAQQAIDWETSMYSDGAGPAESIVRAAKAKYSDAEWARVAPPLRDVLRERLRSTLVAYLVAKRGYEDSDDLFANLLVDVETSPAVITSRLKQAIGSVQTFVQRALMNLESGELKLPEEAAREWAWRKSFRVWEASRKVLLQTELYLDPSLRDDKSPFFKALEAELRQQDITDDSAERAFERYLDRLDEVANLEIASAFHQEEEGDDTHLPIDVLHVVGRTAAQPYKYFYRTRVDGLSWTPWEPIDLDIEGDRVLLAVVDRRPHLYWPIIEERAEPVQPIPSDTREAGKTAVTSHYIRLAWSQRRNGAWGARRMSGGSEVTLASESDPDRVSLFVQRDDEQDPPAIAAMTLDGTGGDRLGHFAQSACGALEGTQFISNYSHFRSLSDGMPLRTGWRGQHVVSKDATELVVPVKINGFLKWIPLLGSVTPFRALIPREIGSGHFKDTASAGVSFFFKDARSTFFADLVLTEYTEWDKATQVQPGMTAYGDIGLKFGAFAMRAGSTADEWAHRAPEETRIAHVYEDAKRYRFMSFYHPYACLFRKELQRSGVDGLLKWSLHPTEPLQLRSGDVDAFKETYDPDPANVLTPYPKEEVDFSFQGAYSIYNWELFFHAPFLIALRLMQSGRHAEAQRWLHFIFDPTTGDPAPAPERFWNVRPFRENKDLASIEDELRELPASEQGAMAKLISALLTNQGDASEKLDLAAQIEAWREDPFNPHLVARMRPIAYQKAVVSKYIENLIAWGDQLFRRETIESINEATQLYILAGNILGRRPARVERKDAVTPRNYWQLEALGLGDLSDPVIGSRSRVEAESLAILIKPPHPTIHERAPDLGELYFCVPRDEALSGLWDTVADRLFKIRHSMNIDGSVRTLPLFEPPIDPMLLVQARALGVDLATVLGEASSPRLPYRFQVVLAKAAELCGAVSGLGAALLAAMEKKDGEAIARLRSGHEVELLAAVREIKAQQVKETQATVASLERSLETARLRRDHYAGLPRISAAEQGALAMSITGLELGLAAQVIAAVAPGVEATPSTTFGGAGTMGSPVALTTIGGQASGASIEAAAQALSMAAGALREGASIASTIAGYERRAEEWALQERLAAKEMQGLEKQIVAAKIRAAVAEVELRNHDRQTEQAREVLEFLRDRKRTTEELYDWMVAELSTVHYQTYTLAFDMARRAERALRFELGTADSTPAMVRFGAWDSLKQGLLAGERLQHDLRRLEAAFLEQTPREAELVKNVSLAEVAPEQLMRLRETGTCDVVLTQEVFDLDYPGHYFRRIKSVAVTIPTVTGPYAGVSCTLTLSNTRVRPPPQPAVTAETYPDTEGFRTDLVPLTDVIATSGGVNDAGLFEPNLRDERYLPFEGAGVLGTYKIELPAANNRFDIAAVSDVILHIRYTARSNSTLAAAAKTYYHDHPPVRRRLFSLRSELPAEWARFMVAPSDDDVAQQLSIPLTPEMFPYAPATQKIALKSYTLYARWNGKTHYSAGDELQVAMARPGVAEEGPLTLNQFPLDSTGGCNTGASDKVNLSEGERDLGTWTLGASRTQVGVIDDELKTEDDRLNDTLQDIYLLCEYGFVDAIEVG
ncbi:neuraminidase-like domain-containing protein [Sorangium sp. So ce124]|uniref:Tc toxin subunit A-related protein n=1 Tax=Sorangium sp. So ce124 TaxID=3133280 RepID=UPI003F606D07